MRNAENMEYLLVIPEYALGSHFQIKFQNIKNDGIPSEHVGDGCWRQNLLVTVLVTNIHYIFTSSVGYQR